MLHISTCTLYVFCSFFIFQQALLFTLSSAEVTSSTGTEVREVNIQTSTSEPDVANTANADVNDENNCRDTDKRCRQLASIGECLKDLRLLQACARSCNSCSAYTNLSSICNRDFLKTKDSQAYFPKDLNKILSGIKNSKPVIYGDVNILSTDPWILTIDDFITKVEINTLLKLRSDWYESGASDVVINASGLKVNFEKAKRNSKTAWCLPGHECGRNIFVRNLLRKIERLIKIPSGNFEAMQMVKYLEHEEYGAHNDYDGSMNVLSPQGPRILTVLMYMSDVEEGGETSFPLLGLDVKPKKGMYV
jgi:hypothetical protein